MHEIQFDDLNNLKFIIVTTMMKMKMMMNDDDDDDLTRFENFEGSNYEEEERG